MNLGSRLLQMEIQDYTFKYITFRACVSHNVTEDGKHLKLPVWVALTSTMRLRNL